MCQFCLETFLMTFVKNLSVELLSSTWIISVFITICTLEIVQFVANLAMITALNVLVLLNSCRLWSCKILQKSNLHSHDKSSLWSSYVIIWQFTLQLLCYQNFRTSKLFKEVLQNEQNKLHELLSARSTCILNLRNKRKFKPVFKTNR